MRKLFYVTSIAAILVVVIFSCKKSATVSEESPVLSSEEKALIKSAGFDENWSERTADGSYLIEGDILLTRSQLQDLVGVLPTKELIIGNEEHYRTTNLVSTPGSTVRTITVSLASGFPSYYSAGLDLALAHYNTLGLKIFFQRVSSNGNIHIGAANLGRSFGGGCILGQSAGFPDASGNPAPGFTLSTNKCATSYINTAAKADEVMAHEIGHCIGFRHTDFMNRISCGSNSNEGTAGVGAIHIDGTIGTVTSGNYNSWMMACVNGDNSFSAEDNFAIKAIYQ